MTHRNNNLEQNHVTELLDDYRRGLLPAEEKSHVESHLASCPECSRDLKFREALAAQLQNATSTAPVPTRLSASVLQAIKDETTPTESQTRKSRPILPWILSAAAVAIVVIGSLQIAPLNHSRSSDTIAMNSPDYHQPATVKENVPVVLNSQGGSSATQEKKQAFAPGQSIQKSEAIRESHLAVPAAAPAMAPPPSATPSLQLQSEPAPASTSGRARLDSANYETGSDKPGDSAMPAKVRAAKLGRLEKDSDEEAPLQSYSRRSMQAKPQHFSGGGKSNSDEQAPASAAISAATSETAALTTTATATATTHTTTTVLK